MLRHTILARLLDRSMDPGDSNIQGATYGSKGRIGDGANGDGAGSGATARAIAIRGRVMGEGIGVSCD